MALPEVAQPHGFLHRPSAWNGVGVTLSHGASSNASAPLLANLAEALCEAGYLALRVNLPFRRARPTGPPSPAAAAKDQEGIEAAAGFLRELGARRVVLAGHSYGGRQSSMLAAGKPECAEGLLLLSYPLHPPGKALQLRTAHFPDLRIPVAFIHGTRDPFGSISELEEAIRSIPARARIAAVPGAGHDLRKPGLAQTVLLELADLLA